MYVGVLLPFGALYSMVESRFTSSVLVAGVCVFYLADVCTVRLLEPKSYRRFIGYEV